MKTSRVIQASLLIFSIILPAISFADIDGGSESALQEHADLARSIVKFETGAMLSLQTCTATVIAKNTLLTARHCLEGLKVNDRVTLNEAPIYRISEIASQPNHTENQIEFITPATYPPQTQLVSNNTDIGIFKVTAIGNEKSTIEDLSPIPIASLSSHLALSQRVWVVGYGYTGPNQNDAGTLHAGYTTLDLQDYVEGPTLAKVSNIQEYIELARVPMKALDSVESRTVEFLFTQKSGKYINSKFQKRSVLGEDGNHAQVQHGDSGGPLIAFDAKGRGYIVGVNSMAASKTKYYQPKIVVRDPQGGLLFEITIPLDSDEDLNESALMDDSWNFITQKLEEKGLISPAWKVTQDFEIAYVTKREALSHFASLQIPLNQNFLKIKLEPISVKK